MFSGHFCIQTQTHTAAPSAIGCCSQKFHQMRNNNVGYTIRIPRQRCRCTNKQTQNGTLRAHWFGFLFAGERKNTTWRQKRAWAHFIPYFLARGVYVCVFLSFLSFSVLVCLHEVYVFCVLIVAIAAGETKTLLFRLLGYFLSVCRL